MAGATAQNDPRTWRCAGNRYSDQPCPEGKAIDVADPRSPADRRAAEAAARRDRADADALERERRRREAQARRDGQPIVIGKPQLEPAPVTDAAAVHGKKKKGKRGTAPEYFTAHDPEAASGRKKTK